MKLKNVAAIMLLLFFSFTLLHSCKKEDDSKKEYGFSKIYMPQAIIASGGVDNNYPVPTGADSSTFNYIVNKASNKIDVILGASLSGPASGAYSVNVSVNTDTIQKLLANGTYNPATYLALPASMYSIPAKLEVAAGSKNGTFHLSIDIDQLKSAPYVGKFLILAVKISNPTQYELNGSLSTTIVVLDVNTLVIGPRKDLTSQYLLNFGNPFIASGLTSGQTRWGTLKDWKTNASVLSHGGFGGYSMQTAGAGFMNMESGWGSAVILNGKIFQTITLPAGTYYFDISGGSWQELYTKDPAYSVVALNVDSLPDYKNIVTNSSIMYQPFVKPQVPISFQLSAPTKVTIGVVVNYVQDGQGFKTKQVSLFNYPKHL